MRSSAKERPCMVLVDKKEPGEWPCQADKFRKWRLTPFILILGDALSSNLL